MLRFAIPIHSLNYGCKVLKAVFFTKQTLQQKARNDFSVKSKYVLLIAFFTCSRHMHL